MFEWYEDEVRALEQVRLTTSPTRDAVAFYGSSSIRLWTTLADDFADEEVLNLGFGGSTLAACAWFFERLVVPHCPRSLVFYAGDNDLGDGQSPADVARSFRVLLQKIDQYLDPIPFSFISIKPSPARWSIIHRIRQTNAMIQQELSRRECAYYLDVFTAMTDAKGFPRRELFAEDGLHLSPAGYKVWKEIVQDQRDKIF